MHCRVASQMCGSRHRRTEWVKFSAKNLKNTYLMFMCSLYADYSTTMIYCIDVRH